MVPTRRADKPEFPIGKWISLHNFIYKIKMKMFQESEWWNQVVSNYYYYSTLLMESQGPRGKLYLGSLGKYQC